MTGKENKENEILIDTSLIMLKKIELDLKRMRQNANDGTDNAVDLYLSDSKKTKKGRFGGIKFIVLLTIILITVSVLYVCHKLGRI
ncbi:hypothetical protein THOM_1026 [Trachipleistophora hominis]|uniref:Uncharacterized protein n=1 Tax=Trachipleistophora hominis TaxID=72359 RepID=L7JX28_TRAHO|nr:hypothetical protein THOM_1026 [Trachipleistophora hominis]